MILTMYSQVVAYAEKGRDGSSYFYDYYHRYSYSYLLIYRTTTSHRITWCHPKSLLLPESTK